ncbi:hypothetical protein [Verrucomicrobium spinosum]|uniref:hypothetical protein n=1 Tax=Verrucomicrobium spinosum TaxID=2736 RepID=UPI0001744B2B|nr:hypothetical protein [Verrucomicrobium spinosum]
MNSNWNSTYATPAASWLTRSGMFQAIPVVRLVVLTCDGSKQAAHEGTGRQIQI